MSLIMSVFLLRYRGIPAESLCNPCGYIGTNNIKEASASVGFSFFCVLFRLTLVR